MDKATPERIRRYFGESTNPLECIVRDIVMTHGAHSDDIRAEVAYLFHKHFEACEQCADLAQLISAVLRFSACWVRLSVWWPPHYL